MDEQFCWWEHICSLAYVLGGHHHGHSHGDDDHSHGHIHDEEHSHDHDHDHDNDSETGVVHKVKRRFFLNN